MIAVIQFRTDESLEHEKMCFRKHLPDEKIDFISIFSDDYIKMSPEDIMKKYDKVILAGSGQFLISRWDNKTAELYLRVEPLIEKLIKKDHPTMGVCFGHQLVSKEQACRVENDMDMAEAGIQTVRFTDAGHSDPLFNGINDPLSVAVGHEDSVLSLPKNAVHLSYSSKCVNQAYKINNNVYCVQFHVELDGQDLKDRLSLYPQYDDHRIGYDYEGHVNGPQVLRNFVAL